MLGGFRSSSQSPGTTDGNSSNNFRSPPPSSANSALANALKAGGFSATVSPPKPPPQTYECPHCQKAFNQRAKMESHVAGVHGPGPRFPCPICDKLFTYKQHVYRHCRNVHKMETHVMSEFLRGIQAVPTSALDAVGGAGSECGAAAGYEASSSAGSHQRSPPDKLPPTAAQPKRSPISTKDLISLGVVDPEDARQVTSTVAVASPDGIAGCSSGVSELRTTNQPPVVTAKSISEILNGGVNNARTASNNNVTSAHAPPTLNTGQFAESSEPPLAMAAHHQTLADMLKPSNDMTVASMTSTIDRIPRGRSTPSVSPPIRGHRTHEAGSTIKIEPDSATSAAEDYDRRDELTTPPPTHGNGLNQTTVMQRASPFARSLKLDHTHDNEFASEQDEWTLGSPEPNSVTESQAPKHPTLARVLAGPATSASAVSPGMNVREAHPRGEYHQHQQHQFTSSGTAPESKTVSHPTGSSSLAAALSIPVNDGQYPDPGMAGGSNSSSRFGSSRNLNYDGGYGGSMDYPRSSDESEHQNLERQLMELRTDAERLERRSAAETNTTAGGMQQRFVAIGIDRVIKDEQPEGGI